MKKTINLFKSALLAAALVFSFAACTNNAETSSNELAGKTFSYSSDWGTEALSFTDDTFTITSTSPEYFHFYDNETGDYIEINTNIRKTVETYTYTIENDPDYAVCNLKSRKTTYLKDGKTISDDELPETLSAYIEKRKNFLKAIFPAGTSEEVINNHLYNDLSINIDKNDLTDNIYQNYKKAEAKDLDIEKSFNLIMPYKFEGSNLKVVDEYFVIWVPEGLKLGDIYNQRYEYETKDTSDYDIYINHYTLSHYRPCIIFRNESQHPGYTILSATNDKIVIAEKTGYDIFCKVIYDTDNPITCKVTYKEGKDKTIGTIDIKGNKYPFDIQYLTTEKINKFFDEGDEVLILKQK